MPQTPAAIQAAELSHVFDHRTVLRNVGLTLAEAECVALIGANGAGKTTLLRCLAGALRPTRGTVRWFGNAQRSSPDVRRQIGFVAHACQLYPQLTVRENLVFAARMSGVARAVERTEHLLATTELRTVGNWATHRISCGMRQRLSVVRGLIHQPRIILLDEPSSGLDQQGMRWLVDLMQRLCDRGRTICFSTHDRQLPQVATRVLSLRSGELFDEGMPIEPAREPSRWAAWGGEAA